MIVLVVVSIYHLNRLSPCVYVNFIDILLQLQIFTVLQVHSYAFVYSTVMEGSKLQLNI